MDEFRLSRREQLFFDNVEIGSEIRPLVIGPINVGFFALWSGVGGDFSSEHYDHKVAQRVFATPPTMHGVHITAYLGRMMTEWIGPNGVLKKIGTQIRHPAYPGDTLTMKGKVTKKYVQNDEYYIDCDIFAENQNGEVISTGSATVTLPSKSLKN